MRYIGIALAGCLVLVMAGVATAGTYSPILAPSGPEAGERNVAQILNDLLGHNPGWSTLTLTNVNPLTNVNLGAGRRVFDEGISQVTDKIWVDGQVKATFTAMWFNGRNDPNNPNTRFGYTLNAGARNDLFETHAPGGPPDLDWGGSVTTTIGLGDIRWYAFRDHMACSDPAFTDPNLYGQRNESNDVMVAFKVDGMSVRMYDPSWDGTGTPRTVPFVESAEMGAYLLFFETRRGGDYNDLVVLVQGANPVVPEPLTCVGVLLGVGSCWAYMRKRMKDLVVPAPDSRR